MPIKTIGNDCNQCYCVLFNGGKIEIAKCCRIEKERVSLELLK